MRRAALVLAALLALLAAATPAAADFSRPELVSVSPREQADSVTSSVISGDGRYLVFAGSLDGLAGILRRDLQTGEIEPVAAASAYGGSRLADASNPSVSADGRYVSFTTTVALDPANDANSQEDVYVRDMDAEVPGEGAPCVAGEPCAYTLASAVGGGTEALEYSGAGSGRGSRAGRHALSADGRLIVFITSESDLGSGPPAPDQVAVRDLETLETTLVSGRRDPLTGAVGGEQVPGGAVSRGQSLPGNNDRTYPVLSSDGSTVAWSAIDVKEQAETVEGDPARGGEGYNEVLWRRIADGPSAPIRRVIGSADPEAPGCHGRFDEPACQGPYKISGGDLDFGFSAGWNQNGGAEPSISADGWTVATVGMAGTSTIGKTRDADLFVADMHPGRAMRDAVEQLTALPESNGTSFGTTANIPEAAISPNGTRIAFVTSRREIALPTLTLVTPPPAKLGFPDLWLADLEEGTVRRLSVPFDGGASSIRGASPQPTGGGGASSPSFDASGRLITFDTRADNMVAVDANEANDAFLVRDTSPPSGRQGRVDISLQPQKGSPARRWRLSLRAVSLPDGTVRIEADSPGTGKLRAAVTALVPEWRRIAVADRSGKRRRVRRRVPVPRRVAVASLRVRHEGLARMVLRAKPAFRGKAHRDGGLDGTAKITFAARGHAKLQEELAVRFHFSGKVRR